MHGGGPTAETDRNIDMGAVDCGGTVDRGADAVATGRQHKVDIAFPDHVAAAGQSKPTTVSDRLRLAVHENPSRKTDSDTVLACLHRDRLVHGRVRPRRRP